MIHDLKTLIDHGLCISDLSSHDLSRDIMMANMQKQFESNMSNKMSIDNSVKLADIGDISSIGNYKGSCN